MIWMLRCKLMTDDVVNFKNSLQGFNWKRLNFSKWGCEGYSDWGNHPERFSNLIEGLGKSDDVRKNLKEIGLKQCGIERSKVEEIFEENRFNKEVISNYSK